MLSSLKTLYANMKVNYLGVLGYDVPSRYQSSFVHWGGGADVQIIYEELMQSIPPPAKVLIVGVMGGRDYFLLKNLGYAVTAIDIGEQPDISPIVISNIEDRLPFPDGSFDLVLIGEVLEHLKRDADALDNISRILKQDGVLIVSVPFYNDWEDGHMRIHSPISIIRLLGMAGFQVKDYLERPGIAWPIGVNAAQHVLSAIWLRLTGNTLYPAMRSIIRFFEWRCGHFLWLRPIRKTSVHFGAYVMCIKNVQLDHIAVNRQLYTLDKNLCAQS